MVNHRLYWTISREGKKTPGLLSGFKEAVRAGFLSTCSGQVRESFEASDFDWKFVFSRTATVIANNIGRRLNCFV